MILSRRQIRQFFALENPLRHGAIEIAFPCGHDDGGDAIAGQIAERARHADEPVDQQHQRAADLGNTGAAFRAARPAKMSDANF
jgi:hypothetical protein